MILLAVNFHYIQPEGRYPHAGIFPTPVEALEAQLGELGRAFEFVSGEELLAARRGERALPERACLITFDDGLKEQYAAAAPALENHGVRGVFFISTQPVAEGRALTVHKMHRLRATRSPERFLQEVQEAGGELGIEIPLERVDMAAADRQYLYDDPATKRLKFLLNHVMPFADFERLIAHLFERDFDERAFCEEMYMSPSEIADLARRHSVGSHAHGHLPLASLAPAARRDNLGRSRETLNEITGLETRLISYPYGGPTAVDRRLAETASALGFEVGFTMERSVNRSLQDPLLLARVSTNDALGGKSPLMSLDGSRAGLLFTEPMKPGRTLYTDERPLWQAAQEGVGG